MKRQVTPTRSGFTLIELLTVIAIIGILAAILIPAVGAVRTKAAQAASQSDLRQIATSYQNFSIAGSRTRIIAQGTWSAGEFQANTPGQWAQVLAEFGGLNDAPVYFISSDPRVAQLSTIPKVILSEGEDQVSPTEEWSDATDSISYEMAAGISPNAQASVTPLIWTRGIEQSASEWSNDSPWEGDGGHIGFLDGHVAFFESIEGQLVDEDGNQVDSLSEAFSDRVDILESTGGSGDSG